MAGFPRMTASRPSFQLSQYNAGPILANSTTGASRSHFYPSNPSPVERFPRSTIRPVHLSTEFLLKPQTQHFLNFDAVHNAWTDSKSKLESRKSEEAGRQDTEPKNVPPTTTSNSTDAPITQTGEVSNGIIHEHMRSFETEQVQVGGYYSSPAFLDPPVFTPSPPHLEYQYESNHVVPSFSVAHQPIPLDRHSTYSELAPHLEFMEKLQQEQECGPRVVEVQTRKVAQVDRVSNVRKQRKSTFPIATKRSGRLERRSGSVNLLGQVGEDSPTKSSRSGRTRLTPFPRPDRASSEVSLPETRSMSSKKPNLACTFCRERKIVCDRGLVGRMDISCTPCTLRSFNCVLMKTSKVNQLTSAKS